MRKAHVRIDNVMGVYIVLGILKFLLMLML